MLRIRIELDGNPALCEPYRPFGESQARRMHALGGGSKTWPLGSVLVKVHVFGDDATVLIRDACLTQLESGVINVGHYSMAAYPETVDTCMVYRAGLTDIVADPTLGTVRMPAGDPYKSELYALKEPPTTLPVNPPPNPADYESPFGGLDIKAFNCAKYPDQCELARKKAVLMHLNPSRGTGKMRLFLQAVLGSLVDRIHLASVGGVLTAMLDTHLQVLTTSYVIRDTHGEYWLMNPVTSYHMTFSTCADRIKSKLRAGGLMREEESKLEAVLFTYLYVTPPEDPGSDDPEKRALPGQTENLWPVPTGAALQYDWHFAYQKAEAIRVGHVSDPNNLDGNCDQHLCRLEKMVFTTPAKQDGAFLPPVASLEVLESGVRSLLRGQEFIWNIDPTTRTQYTHFPHTCLGSFSAPMYAFYDKEDEPLVVRYTRSGATAAPKTIPYDSRGVCGVGTWGDKSIGAGSITSGFTCSRWSSVGLTERTDPSTGYERTMEVGSSELVAEMDLTDNTYDLGGLHLFPLADLCDVDPFYAEYEHALYTWNRSRGTAIETTRTEWGNDTMGSFLLFPLDNPDAIYIGKRNDRARQDTATHTTHERALTGEELSNGSIHYKGTTVWLSAVAGKTGDTHIGYSGGISDTGANEVVLFTQHHSVQVAASSYGRVTPAAPPQVTTVSGDEGPWKEVFNPKVTDGIHFNVHYRVLESTNGRMQYDTTSSGSLSIGGFPVANNIFIGYA